MEFDILLYPVQASGPAMLPEVALRFKEVTVHPPRCLAIPLPVLQKGAYWRRTQLLRRPIEVADDSGHARGRGVGNM